MRLLWLLPIVNAAAFFAAIFFGKSVAKGKAQVFTLLAVVPSWVLSMVALVQSISTHDVVHQSVRWMDFGAGEIRMGVHVDGFAVIMCVVVTSIAMMVQIYSTSYMRGEVRYVQYMATLALFTASMLLLVLSDNLLLGLFGWEGMGLCSYLLIGHYFEERENGTAAIKAFLTTRTGDLGLVFGTIVCFWTVGTFNFEAINLAALEGEFAGSILEVAAVLLLIGAMGKSAQFPLHTWLPDAMAGPTPVSALIHAATMVVAGVYLVARMFPVFVEAFDIYDAAGIGGVQWLVLVGGVTALIGAVLAFVQDDIKKVLAYSTISQLGYMFMALGVGAWGAAIFHLFTHAFFKALLFLGSGSVIHSVHTNDMKEMGGLRKVMPRTYWTWMVGTLALCGIVPFAGFWSKDEILASAFHNDYVVFWVVGVSVAFMTAFYMFRATHLTFHHSYRGHGHPHESDGLITGPLVFLAIPSIFLGFLGLPGRFNIFEKWVENHAIEELLHKFPALHPADVTSETWVLGVVSLAVAGLGILGATYVFYWRKTPGDLFDRVAPLRALREFLRNKLYLDHVYNGLTVWIRDPLSKATYWTNMHIIDPVINLTAAATVVLGKASYWFDQRAVDAVYNDAAFGADRSGRVLRRIQTGRVQQYAAALFAATALLGLVLLLVR